MIAATEVLPSISQLSDQFIQAYSTKQVPWGPVGFVVYKRTYARRVEGQDRTEEWFETVARCVNDIMKISRGAISLEEGEKLYDHVFNLRACFSGRSLWQLGSPTVSKLGASSLINCWGVNMDSIDSFTFLFDQLMLGGGVGFNIQREYVYQLPPVKHKVKVERKDTKDADFIVPDSREGWVELMRRTLDAYFVSGKSFTYSTVCIRGKGTPINGFGGVASGPEDLVSGLGKICAILDRRFEKRLRPIDVLDVNTIIGSIVVAGNVRRSALIAIGDPDDFNFLRAKRWSLGTVPSHRAMSNNTVLANKFDHIADEFWNGYAPQEGEPYGLFNRDLARRKGRLKDSHRHDSRISVMNPCGEITLENGEACNLTEIFMPNVSNKEEFKEIAQLLYKVAKVITTLPYHWKQSQDVISRNRRLGCSLTGVVQAPELTKPEVLDEVYQSLERSDVEFSKTLSAIFGYDIRPSIKLTTIKPSGTLSLLAGVSPGCHAEYSPYYIRRVRMATNDPLVNACRDAGYRVESVINIDGTRNHDTQVVEFPVKARDSKAVAALFTAIDQLNLIMHLQTYWADNSVSCTVYYKPEELPAIKDWLANNYNNGIKSVSFLLHSEHGFVQPPLEEITKEEYEKRLAKVRPISLKRDSGGDIDNMECAGGACPIK